MCEVFRVKYIKNRLNTHNAIIININDKNQQKRVKNILNFIDLSVQVLN